MSENNIVSFASLQQMRKEKEILGRWKSFYSEQPHEELLDALVYEHENDFPLRRSSELLDQLRHQALVETLQEKARTQFLRSFLAELEEQNFQSQN